MALPNPDYSCTSDSRQKHPLSFSLGIQARSEAPALFRHPVFAQKQLKLFGCPDLPAFAPMGVIL
jgi:hypothetical protein